MVPSKSTQLDARVERMSRRDVFNIPEIKENPLAVILIKRFTVGEMLDSRTMVEIITRFVTTKSIDEKLEVIFTIYDLDHDGLISSKDLFDIIKMLNRGILDDRKIQNIVDRTLATTLEYKLTMTCEEFKTIIKHTTKRLNSIFGCYLTV